MKATHIVLLVIIACLVGFLAIQLPGSTGLDDRASFGDAKERKGEEVKVFAYLNKERIVVYDPLTSADETTFYAIDKEGKECKVVLHKPKPQDFERSENLTLTGKYHEGVFHATDVLMKCPSKYEDGKGVKDGEYKEIKG